VAQQLLHDTNRALSHQPGCEGVPKHMWSHTAVEGGLAVGQDQSLHSSAAEGDVTTEAVEREIFLEVPVGGPVVTVKKNYLFV